METRDLLRFALPDCRELDELIEHLRAAGFVVPDLATSGLHRVVDPMGTHVDFDVFKLAPGDVGTYVEHGIAHLGIKSTDLIRETRAQVWRPFTFSYGAYPLILAAPKGFKMENLTARPILRLATSLPQLTRAIFGARGFAVEIVDVQDPATACLLGLADGWVGRMVDPIELVDDGFRVMEVLDTARPKLVVNRACYALERRTITELLNRLTEHMPPAPDPPSIPFDVED